MRSRGGRLSAPLVIVGVGLLAATPAVAYICHPDAKGTRTLSVTGRVDGYALRGATVRVTVNDKHGCLKTAVWRPFHGNSVQAIDGASTACVRVGRSGLGRSVVVPRNPEMPLQFADGARRAVLRPRGVIDVYRGNVFLRRIPRSTRTPAAKIVLNGDRLVVLARGSSQPDRPFRLEVYSTRNGHFLHDWPLVAKPVTLDLEGSVALYSAARYGGLFALRLSDGKTTSFGPVQPGDKPQIDRYGVVYQSNMYERLNRRGRVLMKFLPRSLVRNDFAKTFDSIRTRRPITGFAMDGQRVAVVVDAPGRTCDAVRFWNIPWHYFAARINMRDDLTCAHGLKVGDLAIGGMGAEWIATKAGRAKVIVSDSKKCMERAVGAVRVAAAPLAGDGFVLAYGAAKGSAAGSGAVTLVNWKTEDRVVVGSSSPVRALSVDQNRTAVLRTNGRIDVLDAAGATIGTLRIAPPRAMALRGDELAVLTKADTLEVWNVETQAREHMWRVPEGTRPTLDAHYGIAVFSAGRTVYALQLATGRLATLARVPGSPRVQIEDPGVVYEYNSRSHGFLKFIALATVEHALRSSGA
jgi:hypothetical protein